ncbi:MULTISPECIES: hypothetical protein [unclassified Paenibacillus]|uniref:hypothetical protein n=1 Tax=unclassified Paenibacillus TaxID=185978 RepID=UPI00034ECECF|nr:MULTISPECIES: hypothetical protein [unclassified Paenibacillus]EPD80533.1 hypothetical protein HMPREF1207_05639 [Paenibacillus sp. HGH0039]
MNSVEDLYDKVLYYKGRVWTIYALDGNHDGVFAFQGLKPYTSFKYDSYSHDRNISYLKMAEALECIIEEEKIAECVHLERKADAKKLSKKMAVDFLAHLTGHTVGKIDGEVEEQHNGFTVVLGQVRYDLWKMDGRLHLHHYMHGTTTGTTFDFVTWKVDTNYEDKQRRQSQREEKELIIEEYKHYHHCKCDATK